MLYKLPNLPKVPQHLVDEALLMIQDDDNIAYATPTVGPYAGTYSQVRSEPIWIDQTDGSKKRSAAYSRYTVSQELLEWLKQNIHPDIGIGHDDPNFRMIIAKVGIQIFEHDSPGEVLTFKPHVDGPRGDYVLNYVIEAGGDSVYTKWYRAEGQPLIRPEHRKGLYLTSMKGLVLLDQVVVPQGSWSLVESRVIHTVDNLTSRRVSLSIGFTVDQCARWLNE